jgi:hypothetical protein
MQALQKENAELRLKLQAHQRTGAMASRRLCHQKRERTYAKVPDRSLTIGDRLRRVATGSVGSTCSAEQLLARPRGMVGKTLIGERDEPYWNQAQSPRPIRPARSAATYSELVFAAPPHAMMPGAATIGDYLVAGEQPPEARRRLKNRMQARGTPNQDRRQCLGPTKYEAIVTVQAWSQGMNAREEVGSFILMNHVCGIRSMVAISPWLTPSCSERSKWLCTTPNGKPHRQSKQG